MCIEADKLPNNKHSGAILLAWHIADIKAVRLLPTATDLFPNNEVSKHHNASLCVVQLIGLIN